MPLFEVFVHHLNSKGQLSPTGSSHRFFVEAQNKEKVEEWLDYWKEKFWWDAPWEMCFPCTGRHRFLIREINLIKLD